MALWSGAPHVGSVVTLSLELPLGLGTVETEAVVVFHSQTHAGMQLKLSAVARKALDAAAARCKEAALSAPAASTPPAPNRTGTTVSVPPPSVPPTVSNPPRSVPPRSIEPRSVGSISINTFSTPSRAFEPRASVHEPLRYVEEEIVAGVIPEQTIGNVLLLLGQRRSTGRLDIETEKDRAEIYFRAGSILRVIEDPVRPNRLGDLLVKSGKIRGSDRDGALKDSARTGAPIGESLMRRGVLTAHALKAALSSQLLARCFNQMQRTTGRYTFHAGATPPPGPSIPALTPGTVLFRAPYDHYYERRPDDMDAADNEVGGRFLHRAPDAPDDLAGLGVSEDEQRFWGELVIGAYTLREVYARTSLSRRTAHALIFALVDRGYLRLEHQMAPHHRILKLMEQFETKLGQIEVDTHFGALELHWMANTDDVIAAHRRLREEYGLTHVDIEVPDELRDLSKRIVPRLDQARHLLLAPIERGRYRKSVVEDTQIQVCIDLLLTQGGMALFQGDMRTAIHCFSHVIELDPRHREAAARLADARAGRIGKEPPKRPPPKA